MWSKENFPSIRKWSTPITKDKKVTNSNSSLKLLKRKKICYWSDTYEKLSENSCISCGKDSKKYHKSFVKASKDTFKIANTSVYTNTSQYSIFKACKKVASTINR